MEHKFYNGYQYTFIIKLFYLIILILKIKLNYVFIIQYCIILKFNDKMSYNKND